MERNSDLIEVYKRDVDIAKEAGDRFAEGAAYRNLGNVYKTRSEFIEAIEFYQQHLQIAFEVGDKAGQGYAYSDLGNAYHSIGDLKQAIECHEKHLIIAKEMGDRAGEGRAYCNLENAYHSVGDFKEATEFHQQDLSIALEVGDRAGEGEAYGNLGNAYHSLGDFKKAIDYHSQALSIAKEVGDRAGEGRAYGNLGIAFDRLGDIDQAIKYHKQDLSIAKELEDRAAEGGAYCNLGNAYQSLGDFKQSIEYHKEDLSIAKCVGDKIAEGRAYCNLGNAHDGLGDFKQAIVYHKQDLSIAKEVGDKAGEGRAYCNLGNAYDGLSDFRKAVKYHKKDLSIAKEIGDRDGEGASYGNLGNAYDSLGDFSQAIEYHKENLSIAEEVGDRAGEGRAYGNLGNAYHSVGSFEKAVQNFEKRLYIAKEIGDRAGEGHAYGNLGKAYNSLGNFKKAIEYHKQDLSIAKEIGDRAGEGRACGNLGSAYRSFSDLEKALEYHKQHLSIAKEVGDMVGEGSACYSLGCDLETSGSVHEVLAYYQSSVKIYDITRALLQSEDEWKISFRNQYQNAYTALWRTLLRNENIQEALCAAEHGRAQGLMDVLKLQYGFNVLPPTSFEPNETIDHMLSDESTQTVFLAIESNTINFWILRKGNEVQFRRKKISDGHSHEDAANFLDNLIQNYFHENEINAGVKCENRSLDELRELTDDLRSNERSGQETRHDLTNKNDSLRLLYDCIVAPIVDLLQDSEIIIVPDGPLCLIPYSAFIDDDSKYFSEYIRIRILPSLTSLRMILDSPKDYHSEKGALLVGNPCLEDITKKRGRPVFQQLKHAREEVMMIGKILTVPPLTGREATKDEVLKRIASVALVHIAAHGDAKTGEIALAPNPGWTTKIPKKKDYMLNVADVQAVQLRAKLVVLSCCHSGRGKVTAEGVVGIARAFLGAGARSVLVSLWAIDDEATMQFMKSFYERLSRGDNASLALNQAMKSLRESEKFSAVKYWAPFVLIGDDVKLQFEGKE